MAEQKETIKKNTKTNKPEVRQSVGKALFLGFALLLLARFVIVGGYFGDLLTTVGLIFILVGIVQFIQNKKAKKEKDK